MFCALPVDDVKDADELVDVMLGSEADLRAALRGLCDLLKSIQESAGVVKVREAILAAAGARVRCGESRRVGVLWKAARGLERAWDEREYGSDGATVAGVLNQLSRSTSATTPSSAIARVAGVSTRSSTQQPAR